MTKLGKFFRPASELVKEAFSLSLRNAAAGSGGPGLDPKHVDGLIVTPSLSQSHFMEAHLIATQLGLVPSKTGVYLKTVDTGGAGPITGILEATRLIQSDFCEVVAVAAGDAVLSMSKKDFLAKADGACADPEGRLQSPVIPHGYDHVARYQVRGAGQGRTGHGTGLGRNRARQGNAGYGSAGLFGAVRCGFGLRHFLHVFFEQ